MRGEEMQPVLRNLQIPAETGLRAISTWVFGEAGNQIAPASRRRQNSLAALLATFGAGLSP